MNAKAERQIGDLPPFAIGIRAAASLENLLMEHYCPPTAMNAIHRRQFIKRVGLSTASLPFLIGLPSLGLASPARPRQRLVVVFSPNGTIPRAFWPDEEGKEFKLKERVGPLGACTRQMLILHG